MNTNETQGSPYSLNDPALAKFFFVGPTRQSGEYQPLTFYDLLRRFVDASRWVDEEEHRRAVALVDEMEAVNVFGTLAGQLHTEGGRAE